MNYEVSELYLNRSGTPYPLYRISPPSQKASQFVIMINYMAYLFPTSDPQKIYKYDGVSNFELIAELDTIKAGKFNEIPYDISLLKE